MSKKSITGITGAVFLLIGVLSPVVKITSTTGLTYFQVNNSSALIILTFAGIAILLSVANKPKWLSVIGLVSFLNVTSTYSDFANHKIEVLSRLGINVTGVSLGMNFLIVGACILISTAIIKKNDNEPKLLRR